MAGGMDFGHGGGHSARSDYDPSAWVVPYADLITTLMIFFLLMYAVSASGALDNQKLLVNIQEAMGGKVVKTETQEKKEMEIKIADKLKEHLKGVATVEINSERIKIMLPSPILFDSASAALKPEAKKNLSAIVADIKGINNRLIVEGHTDNVKIHRCRYKSNWELSAARAFSVVKFFVDNHKQDPKRFTVYGFGEYRPMVPNDSGFNRKINRRIEINIIRSQT